MRTNDAVMAVLVWSLAFATSQASDSLEEETSLRELMPADSRCGSSGEPLVYCRYHTTGPLGVALEISNTLDGPAGSLTYNADDTAGYKLLSVFHRLFAREGVKAEALDECIRHSTMGSVEVVSGNRRVRCLYTEVFDRITYEVVSEPNSDISDVCLERCPSTGRSKLPPKATAER